MTTTDRLARLGAVAAVLWAAHDLGDHVVQTDEQAAGKVSPDPGYWPGPMLGHLVGYHATQALALGATVAVTGWRPSWRRVGLGMAVSVLTHGFLDRRYPVRELLAATGSARFASPVVVSYPDPTPTATDRYTAVLPLPGTYLADQALHHVALLGAAAIMIGGR